MERTLVEAAQGGDRDAFATLISSAASRLFAIAFLILRDTDRAEDAVQEAIIRAWSECPKLRDPSRWGAWLYRLTVNACADETRRHRRWTAQVRKLDLEPTEGDPSLPLVHRDELERAFQRLDTAHRAVMVLRFYIGMSVPEVATALGIPLGTAKSRIHSATRSMRSAMETDGPGLVTAREGRPA